MVDANPEVSRNRSSLPNKVEAKPIADIVARSPCGAKVSGALRRLTMYSPRTGKTVRGQVDSVDIKQELVLQCGIADAGQRARAGVGEPVARGIGLDQRSEQAGVDVFDAHAGICDAGKRDLHQIVAGLAVGRADQGIGNACRFRQFADVADGEDDVAGAIANQRVDAVDRVGGAGRGRHGYGGERAASLIILAASLPPMLISTGSLGAILMGPRRPCTS
jgi:hypothetical protein